MDFMGFNEILWDLMGFDGILWDLMGFNVILGDLPSGKPWENDRKKKVFFNGKMVFFHGI